jgi:hypothetical protein
MALNSEGVYELTGTERKEEEKVKTPDCEIVTTSYFNGDTLVRVDKTINVDPVFVTKLSTKL